MNKSIEDRVKDIVETNGFLSLKEKSEIICLIECYKGADLITKQLMNERYQLQNKIDNAIEYIEHKKFIREQVILERSYKLDDFEVRKLLEILKDGDVDE